MRKFLLGSVAALGTGGLIGAAYAQPAPTPGAPTQGQVAYPLVNPTAYVNNNNNYQAPALPGALANPTPGTIVVHVNGKVQTELQAAWTNVDQRFVSPAPAGSPGGPAIIPGTITVNPVTGVPTGATIGTTVGGLPVQSGATPLATVLGANGTGGVKLAPVALNTFARLYFGGDGMATNGLRYGAAIEIRQNFTGAITSNSSSGGSGMSSASTLYVRRAFTYMAGENWGIVRVGIADGLIGIFDNGVTTGQFTIIGELNGGDGQNMPGAAVPPFFFLSQAGNEYDVPKVVYMSPQIAGFDFGIQWAPNLSNGYGLSTGNPYNGTLNGALVGTGLSCTVANSGCPTLSSGPGILDGSRARNWTSIGARYQGKFGDVGLLAYAVYGFSGNTNYTGQTTAAVLGTTTLAGSKFSGRYEGLNYGNAGIAVTFAGFTVGGNIIGGRINGQLGLVPTGGTNELAYTLSAKYVAGPFTVGVVGEVGWYQGNPVLAGISQRRGRAISVGAQYAVAPGFQVAAEYLWNDVQQAGNNMLTGAVGTSGAALLMNNAHGQSLVLGSVVNF